MKKYILLFILLVSCSVFAQKASNSAYEIRSIVDMPTAGTLKKSSYSLNTVTYENGGLSAEFAISPFTNFMLAISYGGIGLIGEGEPTMQDLPGIHIRYRVLDETMSAPAILIGISTQGKGEWDTQEKRFQTMSPGLYIASSKVFRWWAGFVALHGGLNYSFEPKTEDRMANFYAGLEQSIGSFASLTFEYNLNLDEKINSKNSNEQILDNRGMLNSSLRFFLSQNLVFELQMRDLLRHRANTKSFTRYLGIEYSASF